MTEKKYIYKNNQFRNDSFLDKNTSHLFFRFEDNTKWTITPVCQGHYHPPDLIR